MPLRADSYHMFIIMLKSQFNLLKIRISKMLNTTEKKERMMEAVVYPIWRLHAVKDILNLNLYSNRIGIILKIVFRANNSHS